MRSVSTFSRLCVEKFARSVSERSRETTRLLIDRVISAYCSRSLRALSRSFTFTSALLDEVPDYCDETFCSVREDREEAVGDAGEVRLLARFIEEKGL
jgi:hypothetical protein|nr:hypothetical protein [Methanoculleus marisnigri]